MSLHHMQTTFPHNLNQDQTLITTQDEFLYTLSIQVRVLSSKLLFHSSISLSVLKYVASQIPFQHQEQMKYHLQGKNGYHVNSIKIMVGCSRHGLHQAGEKKTSAVSVSEYRGDFCIIHTIGLVLQDSCLVSLLSYHIFSYKQCNHFHWHN